MSMGVVAVSLVFTFNTYWLVNQQSQRATNHEEIKTSISSVCIIKIEFIFKVTKIGSEMSTVTKD